MTRQTPNSAPLPVATSRRHPSALRRSAGRSRSAGTKVPQLPQDRTEVEISLGGRRVKLTNLNKPFWPELGITKRDLLQYADISDVLLAHLRERAMVMKRYPHGAAGELLAARGRFRLETLE